MKTGVEYEHAKKQAPEMHQATHRRKGVGQCMIKKLPVGIEGFEKNYKVVME